MYKICREILRNYKENARCVYPEPSIEIYNESSYSHLNTETLHDKIGYLLKLCPLKPNYHAIDIGSGAGDLVFALAEKGLEQVWGIDASQDAIDIAQNKIDRHPRNGQVHFQQMSATNLEFSDEHFDIAYMADIVEHLDGQNLRKAFSEAYRVLKIGSYLVVHTAPTVNYKRYGQYFAKYYFEQRGITWFTPTVKEESSLGHVNIQSKSSLKNYISEFFTPDRVQVFHAPLNLEGSLKKMISLIGLWPIMSPHLWAIARK